MLLIRRCKKAADLCCDFSALVHPLRKALVLSGLDVADFLPARAEYAEKLRNLQIDRDGFRIVRIPRLAHKLNRRAVPAVTADYLGSPFKASSDND